MVIAGRLDAAGYLRQALVTYSSLEYLKTRAAPGERIFGIGNCSAAYAPDPAAFDCIPPKDAGSARSLEERLRLARAEGVHAVVQKPFAAPYLLGLVAEVVAA